MGPIRRRLITAIFAALPFPALAEMCDKIRPSWDGAPVTIWAEAVYLFSSIPALVLILASLLVIRLRHQWGAVAVVVFWSVYLSLITMTDPSGMRGISMAEGCVGSPTLFIVLVAAICVGMILYTAPLPKRSD